MIGREAYHDPWWMADWDARFFGDAPRDARRARTSRRQMCDYMACRRPSTARWSHIARHMLGLCNGVPGARRWRQVWSDHRLKSRPPHEVMAIAHEPAEHPA